jgi:hypothetical protein
MKLTNVRFAFESRGLRRNVRFDASKNTSPHKRLANSSISNAAVKNS